MTPEMKQAIYGTEDSCVYTVDGQSWRVWFRGEAMKPDFNSIGAARAFLAGLFAGRKPA